MDAQARALVGWMEVKEAADARQAQLRAAVRRMAYLKLHHAFAGEKLGAGGRLGRRRHIKAVLRRAGCCNVSQRSVCFVRTFALTCPPCPLFGSAAWQDLAAYRREAEAEAAALDEAVSQHMQRWRMRRLLREWQRHAAGCTAGRANLQRMAAQAERRAAAEAFGAWRALVAQRTQRLSSLAALVAARQRQRDQAAAFASWRLLVEDQHGARLQERHARGVLARLRLQHAFQAWRGWRQERADRRERWEEIVEHMRARSQLNCMAAAFEGEGLGRHRLCGMWSDLRWSRVGLCDQVSLANMHPCCPALQSGRSTWLCRRRSARCSTSEWANGGALQQRAAGLGNL